MADEEAENELKQKSETERESNMHKTILRLKETISMKENMGKERVEKQKVIIKDLKLALKEYIKKNRQLEAKLKGQEESILRYENELRNSHEDTIVNMERIKQNAIREEQWNHQELDYQRQIKELQDQIQQEKDKATNWK